MKVKEPSATGRPSKSAMIMKNVGEHVHWYRKKIPAVMGKERKTIIIYPLSHILIYQNTSRQASGWIIC